MQGKIRKPGSEIAKSGSGNFQEKPKRDVTKGTLTRYRNAIKRATSDLGKRKAVYAFRDAIDRGLPFEPVMPVVLEAMETDCPDVLVAGTFTLQSAAQRGYDLTPALPRLVHALYFLFRHHAAHVLIGDVHKNPSHAGIIMQAIAAEGRKERNQDLDRVITVCTSGIPAREWKWGKCGVHTFSGCVTWSNDATGRNWSRQNFDEFRRKGAWAPSSIMKEHEVPEKVWQELHQLFGIPARPRRTRENIEAEVASTVARLAAKMKDLPLDQCHVCRSIPDRSWANVEKNDSLTELMKPLENILNFHQGGESFFQCPNCGRLFEYQHEVDNEIGASSDTESLVRRSLESIEKRLREVALGFEWTWSLPPNP